MQDLESLLQEIESINVLKPSEEKREDNCVIPHGGTAKEMQRADKNASLYDFLDMIANVVEYSMSDYNVRFSTDEEQNILKDPEIFTIKIARPANTLIEIILFLKNFFILINLNLFFINSPILKNFALVVHTIF